VYAFSKSIFLLLICSYCWSSCGTYPCAKATLRYHLIGFSEAACDTVIIRKFTKHTTTLIDSVGLYNAIIYERTGDTLKGISYLSNANLESNYDYQLFFPGANKTITISNIQENQTTVGGWSQGCNKTMCINPITRCNVDDHIVQVNFNLIYLRKF
jgi:hypothetical protein